MNTVNYKNFLYKTNSVKINDQIFLQIEKTLFLAISPTSGAKKVFPKNCAFWHHPKLQRNLMIQSQENTKQMSGGKDGQTPFHRGLPATARGLTSTIVVD